jgi:NlpC/P60 family putative phage cell wall peptidase
MDRLAIVAEARRWIGTPYHHKGRVFGAGVDCGGLLYEVYAKFFSLKPFPENYAADWSLHRNDELYLDFISEYVQPTTEPLPADIVVFRFGRCFAHGGIVTETGRVIHAWGRTKFGQVMESNMMFFRDQGKLRPRKFFRVNNNV